MKGGVHPPACIWSVYSPDPRSDCDLGVSLASGPLPTILILVWFSLFFSRKTSGCRPGGSRVEGVSRFGYSEPDPDFVEPKAYTIWGSPSVKRHNKL